MPTLAWALGGVQLTGGKQNQPQAAQAGLGEELMCASLRNPSVPLQQTPKSGLHLRAPRLLVWPHLEEAALAPAPPKHTRTHKAWAPGPDGTSAAGKRRQRASRRWNLEGSRVPEMGVVYEPHAGDNGELRAEPHPSPRQEGVGGAAPPSRIPRVGVVEGRTPPQRRAAGPHSPDQSGGGAGLGFQSRRGSGRRFPRPSRRRPRPPPARSVLPPRAHVTREPRRLRLPPRSVPAPGRAASCRAPRAMARAAPPRPATPVRGAAGLRR